MNIVILFEFDTQDEQLSLTVCERVDPMHVRPLSAAFLPEHATGQAFSALERIAKCVAQKQQAEVPNGRL